MATATITFLDTPDGQVRISVTIKPNGTRLSRAEEYAAAFHQFLAGGGKAYLAEQTQAAPKPLPHWPIRMLRRAGLLGGGQ